MARFVDLDLEDDDGSHTLPLDRGKPLLVQQARAVNDAGQHEEEVVEEAEERPAITRALQCYPIVLAIVSNIDLTTLDALSRTCRLVHNGLIQYRTSLMTSTLRCSNDQGRRGSDTDVRPWNCARDMVSECRKCGDIICRNCAIKPPASSALRERHRRLCRTCTRAPIATLAFPPLDAALSLGSEAIQHAMCKCEDEGVWLCQACGRSIRNADHEYKRIWRWRGQYGESLGGLGTGIGDGDRGVICGREETCLAARDREHEIDCDAEDARGGANTPSPGTQPASASTPTGNNGFPFAGNGTIEALIDDIRRQRTPSPQLGPGYERHEIEGIGGVVKRKLVRMVRVGACVPEWEEERGGGSGSSGKVLAREISGTSRSWCGWCWRAIPGKKDLSGCEKAAKGDGR